MRAYLDVGVGCIVHRRQLVTRALGYSVVFVVVFIPALYFCFENLARLLPENV